MKPRDFLNFFKTKSGKLVTFAVLFATALIIFSALRKQHQSPDDAVSVTALATNATDKPQVVQSVVRPMEAFYPPPPKPEPTNFPSSSSSSSPGFYKPSPLPNVPANQAPTLAPISLFADSSAGIPPAKKLSALFAPFGRLIPCETVVTVDSSSIQTPIIGLITENIYYGGKLVIPAGTEIHGTAQTDHQRERIASGNNWTFIWQNGMEMQIKAIALDREFDNETNQSGWAITDGSAGLRGEVIKSDNFADIKLFAATFLSGAASALTEKQQTVFGPVNSPTLNNAPFAGAQAVLQTYAQQIFDSIQKNGFYVRVPSGKQFYLYVLQTIDAADASLGGTAIPVTQENDEQSPTKSRP
ncbi:MAG TPA: TrbI/VirB10 family protein [Candidatus Limnocylindrales bacterium]|nr:TrbI/VirB10 family protein [Candidatus Limnocylindrales bacterium]